ncbi:MAG: cellulose biosynthesis cyclic di-GMP-binding regulatory protein BcsB, partial [Pseudomonadota bacterium]
VEPVDLQFTYRNSVNLLPSRSRITVKLNGDLVAEPVADAFDEMRRLTVPAANLAPGRNILSIDARQRHRIFCGVDASFAIFTDIDLAGTGITVAPEGNRPGFDVFHALLLGGAPIELRTGPNADEKVVAALATRLAALSPRQSLLAMNAASDPGDGRRQPRILIDGGETAGVEVLEAADGALVLRVIHAPVAGEAAANALPDLSRVFRPLAATLPHFLQPGETTTLGALGFENEDQSAALISEEVTFRLPDSWLALSAQEATLSLEYTFAEGLPQGSQLLINVNGETVRLLPLDEGGGPQPPLEVSFLARHLKPRINRITFKAVLPAANPLLPCPPYPEDILSVSPQSTLSVPDLPEMRFDGMENVLGNLRADGVDLSSFDGADEPSLQIALSALLGAGRETDDAGNGARRVSLTVLEADAFTQSAAGELPLTRSAVFRLFADGNTIAAVPKNRSTAAEAGASSAANGLLDVVRRTLRDAGDALGEMAFGGDPSLQAWLEGQGGSALLLQPFHERDTSLVLVVPREQALTDVITAIVQDRGEAGGPRGRVAVLRSDGGWESWRPPFDPPRLAESLTPSNIRAVLGNYASWSPAGFAATLLLLTLASAAAAIAFLTTTRGRRKQ